MNVENGVKGVLIYFYKILNLITYHSLDIDSKVKLGPEIPFHVINISCNSYRPLRGLSGGILYSSGF